MFTGSMRGKTDLIVVFLNILCHADRDGIADIHWRVIAEETGLSIKKTRAAIKILESPDPESRSPEQEGRRLLRVDDHREWGWQIINYIKYREMRSEEDRRLYMREYMAKKRAVNKIANEQLTELTGKQELAELAKVEVEVEGEVDTDNPPLPPKGGKRVSPKPPPFDPMVLTIPPELETPAFREAWSNWVSHRKQKKSGLTESCAKSQLKKMAAMGVVRAIAMIENSIFRGWTGLFEPDDANPTHRPGIIQTGFPGFDDPGPKETE